MRTDAANERQRAALSCRAIEREYHVSRTYPASLIRAGLLPALKRGRALLVLRRDWEALWHVETDAAANAQRIVERLLARETGP
jgi:hypothetical protein